MSDKSDPKSGDAVSFPLDTRPLSERFPDTADDIPFASPQEAEDFMRELLGPLVVDEEPAPPVDVSRLSERQQGEREEAIATGRFDVQEIKTAKPGNELHEDGSRYFTVSFVEGLSFGIKVPPDVADPEPGDRLVTYGKGFGFTVDGYDLRDTALVYRTQEEQEEERQRWLDEREQQKQARWAETKGVLLSEYEALPEGLRKRVDRFVANCPNDWWVEFGGYEMCGLNVAVLIAEQAKLADDPIAAVDAFYTLPWEEQKERVPGCDVADSGNLFGYACMTAKALVEPDLELREKILEWGHGAMVTLTGCEEYGCIAPPDDVFGDPDAVEEEPDDDPSVDREPVEDLTPSDPEQAAEG